MATGTVTTINTTSVDLSSDLTNGLFTSAALTLSADFVNLSISWSGVDDITDVYITGSNDGTTYVNVLAPQDTYEIPAKKVLLTASGSDRLAVNGLDMVYAKVCVYSGGATEGTVTIVANH